MGHAASMGLVAMAAFMYLGLWAWFRQHNRRKASGKEDYKVQGMSEEEAQELGEHNPAFRYSY